MWELWDVDFESADSGSDSDEEGEGEDDAHNPRVQSNTGEAPFCVHDCLLLACFCAGD
jgi:hypothetical protein